MKASSNDITGDALISKPSTDKYRENHDKIFKPKTMAEITKKYESLGSANSQSFKLPKVDDWRRCHRSPSGNYEVYVSHTLQAYYDIYSD